MSHLQVSLLSLHTCNPLVYLHQIVSLYQLRHQAHQLVIGMSTFASTGPLVVSQVMQLLYDTLHLGMVSLLVLSVGLLVCGYIRIGNVTILADHICILFNGLDILPILTISLISQQQLLSQLFLLLIAIARKGMEVGIIILVQHGINDGVLQLLGCFITLKNLEDERLQEVFLLSEVLLILHITHLEGIHRNRMLLAVRDVSAMEIATDTLIRVTRVNHHHIGTLLNQLAHHGIGRKALSAT